MTEHFWICICAIVTQFLLHRFGKQLCESLQCLQVSGMQILFRSREHPETVAFLCKKVPECFRVCCNEKQNQTCTWVLFWCWIGFCSSNVTGKIILYLWLGNRAVGACDTRWFFSWWMCELSVGLFNVVSQRPLASEFEETSPIHRNWLKSWETNKSALSSPESMETNKLLLIQGPDFHQFKWENKGPESTSALGYSSVNSE